MNFIALINKFLPPTAQLLTLNTPFTRPAMTFIDLDGDGLSEIAAAYKYLGENHIIIIKSNNGHWFPLTYLKGIGYGIDYLGACLFTSRKANNLIVGWQIGSIWSELNIFELTQNGFKNIIPTKTTYSKIDIEEMPNKSGKYLGCRIALWTHDTGDAYDVEVYKFINRKFIPDTSVYPYYFKKVAQYYQTKIKEYPHAAFYWYHLADALLKADNAMKALSVVNKALALPSADPYYKEKLIKLKQLILPKLNMRNINLYPAILKTISGSNWGFINNSGKFLIKPHYDYAMDFQSNDLAVVEKNNLQGLIDISGEYIIKPKYQNITGFSQGLANIIDAEGFKVIDEKGNILTPKTYDYISSYSDNRSMFGTNTLNDKYLYGYLDKQGTEIIAPIYESAYDFNNGKALVKITENEFALIDVNGKMLKNYKHYFVGPLSDGMLAFSETATGKYGYIDENGVVIIFPEYTSASPFEDERAVVNTADDFESKFGLIDKNGNFIIPPKYNEINRLGNNRLAIGLALDNSKPYLGSKFSISDMNGNFLTGFIYNDVTQYKGEFASAYNNTNTFFIDNTGNVVKNLPILNGSGSLAFDENLIKALIDSRLSYLDKAGNVIYSQNKTIPLFNQYKIIEQKFNKAKNYLVYYPQIQGMKHKTKQNTVNTKLKNLSLVKPIGEGSQLDYSYNGDYNVEFAKKDLLILRLDGYNYPFGAAHGMPSMIYPHINLINGNFYKLKELFKINSNYIKILSDIISKRIKDDPQYSYVFPDSFKGISENQGFYLNSATLFIYFTPYEIAPYAVGFPTFKIPFKDIMSIINTHGEFWKSFN